MCFLPVDRELMALLISEEHVLGNAHVGDQRQFLMDDDDAFALAVFDVGELAYFAFVYNVSFVGAVGPQAA